MWALRNQLVRMMCARPSASETDYGRHSPVDFFCFQPFTIGLAAFNTTKCDFDHSTGLGALDGQTDLLIEAQALSYHNRIDFRQRLSSKLVHRPSVRLLNEQWGPASRNRERPGIAGPAVALSLSNKLSAFT